MLQMLHCPASASLLEHTLVELDYSSLGRDVRLQHETDITRLSSFTILVDVAEAGNKLTLHGSLAHMHSFALLLSGASSQPWWPTISLQPFAVRISRWVLRFGHLHLLDKLEHRLAWVQPR